MPTLIDISGNYGRRNRLTYQPQEGPRWKAQDKKCRLSESRVYQKSQMRGRIAPDEP